MSDICANPVPWLLTMPHGSLRFVCLKMQLGLNVLTGAAWGHPLAVEAYLANCGSGILH